MTRNQILVGLSLGWLLFVACGGVDAYRASLIGCVENSPTRAAADRCKAALNDAAVVDSRVVGADAGKDGK